MVSSTSTTMYMGDMLLYTQTISPCKPLLLRTLPMHHPVLHASFFANKSTILQLSTYNTLVCGFLSFVFEFLSVRQNKHQILTIFVSEHTYHIPLQQSPRSSYDGGLKYHPAAEVPIVDAFSHIPPSSQDTLSDVDIGVHQLNTLFWALPIHLQEIRHATAQDETLNALIEMVSCGWPN